MMRRWSMPALILLLMSLTPGKSKSAVIETSVKYVSGQTVYLGAGSNDGVQKGDSADVVRDGQIIALLEVIYVAASSSSAQILSSTRDLRIGDLVRVTASGNTHQDTTATGATEGASSGMRIQSGDAQAEVVKRRSAPRVLGRIAAQALYQDDREATNRDLVKPSLILRTTIENLFANHLSLSVNLRARQVISRSADVPSAQSDWDNRIYEVALHYDDPASPMNFQLGRIASNQISGIGIFDGALVEYGQSGGLSAGVFGGTRPDLTTSKINPEETTAGVFAALETGNWESHRVRGTLALAGRYHIGEIDEEFIYEQVSYGFSQRFLIIQSAEIAINRGWREQAEGSSLGLSNVLMNASYSPVSTLTFDFGYDNRKLMRTYETKDTPDSLFDDALRQGFRLGLTARVPLGFRVWVRGGLRTRETGETDTRTLVGGLTRNSIFHSGVSASVQHNQFENRLSSGYQTSLSLARYFFQTLYLQFEAGTSRYDFTTAEGPVNYHWFQLDASANLTRHIYSSAYGELYRGDAMNTNRFGVELGYRF